ncbi:phosphoribosylanthranilate isomerase [Marivirga harenae]|uniref:phosphoribosylanthranilate isomerase n=1 Tax=Marivirga harenae TaxID=2010992 RepID=UPI0026E0CEC2|nr:phosphoribosylanthranilate isomerase [Marivirga harenae]WKV11616.1 phosphoribosylanthranilate isomerase [Marivirga harenae]|tara:strand:+ start:116677 stop:117306 length:630 start_codon:yes stop_codon:yes gene_type:complete
MALKTFVKISEVNNLSDARYCAGMTVNLMGFNLNKDSDYFVSPENFMELTGWVSGLEFVGEFGHSTEEAIKSIIDEYEIHYLQTDNPAILPLFPDRKKILRFDMDKISDAAEVKQTMEQTANQVEFFLFESDNGIVYKDNVLDQVLDLAKSFRVVLGFNITDANVMNYVNNTSITGISLKGGDEIRPGYKDFDELADILETLEIDDTLE